MKSIFEILNEFAGKAQAAPQTGPQTVSPEKPDEAPPEKLPPSPRNLAGTVVLACVGGLLDSTVYTLHGHVFVTAMTGNVVLLGIALLARQYVQSARHLVPLVAFACGIAGTRIIIRKKIRALYARSYLLRQAAFPSSALCP